MLATRVSLLAVTLSIVVNGAGSAQTKGRYRARLSPVPIDVAMQNVIAGRGTVTATLAGSRLTLTGSFEGLRSPATVARLHVAPKGMRGPAFADMTVTTAVKGTLNAAIDLTPAQAGDLANSRLYVQLHSEKAPDGNLWGWLLPEDPHR